MRYVEIVCAATLFVALVVAPSSRLLAQEGSQYRAIIGQAVAEYEAGRMEEARAFFRRAHALQPNPRTLRGIGMTSYELRDYSTAYSALSDSLSMRDSARPLTPTQREHAQGLLQRTLALIAIWSSIPEGSTVRVDDAPAALDRDGSVIASLGSHTVDMTLADGRSAQFRLEVAGGERGAFPIDWAAFGEPPARSDEASTSTRSDRDDTEAGTASTGESPSAASGASSPLEEPTSESTPISTRTPFVAEDAVVNSDPQYLQATSTDLEVQPPRDSELDWHFGGAFGGIGGGFDGKRGWRASAGIAAQLHVGFEIGAPLWLGAIAFFDHASLAEADALSQNSWWISTGALAAGQLRFDDIELVLGAGLGAAIRDRTRVTRLGERVSETQTELVFPVLVGSRFHFAELLFFGVEGHFALGGYASAVGALMLGVELP